MPNQLLLKPSNADGTCYGGTDTQPPDDAWPRVQEDYRRGPSNAEDVPADAAASNFAVWVSMVFLPTQLRTLPPDPANAPGVFLSNAEVRFLRQIRDDLGDLGVRMRQSSAAELCKKFTDGVGLELANKPGTRVAAFEDEQDMIALVAHCRPSKRQVSFEFHADGITIGIVSIDERMRRTEEECRIHQIEPIRGAIAWLIHRP
jgi:hypothetical protein